MQTELEVAFHNIDHSPALEASIRERVARLERHFDKLTRFRAVFDAPHRHHRKGKQYAVRLEAHLPGAVLMVNREPGENGAHQDAHVAIRDAFDAMERKIKAWTDQHTGRPETRAEPLQGRVAQLEHERGFGQIALNDGRLVYFHRNAVVDARFEDLSVDETVEVALHEGDSSKGPHASTVRPISTLRFVGERR